VRTIGNIEFTTIKGDFDNAYLDEEHILAMGDYFRKKARQRKDIKLDTKWYLWELRKGLLIYTLYYTGRRIGELIGKRPYRKDKYPGLRPIDISKRECGIVFGILKKGQVATKDKEGKPRSKSDINKLKESKIPQRTFVPVSLGIYNTLVRFIKKHSLLADERIFPFGMTTAHDAIKEAAKHVILPLSGYQTRVVRSKNVGGKQKWETKKVMIRPRLHMLRHSYAINFLKKNTKRSDALPILQDQLCHSDISVTKTYMKFSTKDRVELLTRTFSPNVKERETLELDGEE